MAIIGTAYVQIRADDKNFESDVRAAARRIKNVAIQLKADVDMTKASKKIRDLRYRITSKDAVLKIDANVSKADEKMAKLLKKFLSNDLEFNAIANTAGADTQLSELKARYTRNHVPFTANADTKMAEAQLAFAARRRTAKIGASLDPKTLAALKGLFNTITGTIPYDKIRGMLSGIAANFEGIAVKGASVVTILGAISALVLDLGANILSVGGDITQAIGLVALFPAALGSMVSMMVATKMAWANFGKAFSKDAKKSAEALALLPKEAQNTVKGLKGVYTQIQKPVQKAFWVSMGTSLQDTVKRLLPALTDGFVKVGGSLGTVTKEVALAFGRLGDGTLQKMFEDLSGFLDNMAPGMGRFIDALNILGKVGATYLPQFGTYLTDIATQFKGFIEESEKAGKINDWIETGVRRLQEMGSIVKSTTGIFSGLADAARMAGAPGLTEMAESMRNIRDTVQGEPFQTRLTIVLKGAREGADKMGDAFGRLTTFIGNSSVSIGIFLQKAGEVAAMSFDSIVTLFDGTGLGGGLVSLMDGLKIALDTLQPGFKNLGSALGNLGKIAGAVIQHMAPGLNQLFETIDLVIESVKDGIMAVLPVFSQFVQVILMLIQGPIVQFTSMIGGMLEAFAKMPGILQTIIMSIGLFLLLKPRFAGFFSGLSKSLTNEETNLGRSMNRMRSGFTQIGNYARDGFATVGASAKNAMVESTNAVGKALSNIAPRAAAGLATFKSSLIGMGEELKEAVNPRTLMSNLKASSTGFALFTDDAKQKFSDMGTKAKSAITSIGEVVAPTGGRIRALGSYASAMATNMHADLAPARQAFTDLGNHARIATTNAVRGITSGLKNVVGGLGSAIGGPWGIALAGLTIGIGLFAQAAGEGQKMAEGFKSEIDEVTGTLTEAGKKSFATKWMDLDTSGPDDLARAWGQFSASVEETTSNLGLNIEEVNNKLTDGNSREKYLNDWQNIRDALHDGTSVTEEMATAVGSTSSKIYAAGYYSIDFFNEKIHSTSDALTQAEKDVLAMGKATGKTTVEAAALTKNYDILSKSTSSVSDKFSAFKQNLDITTGGIKTARTAARDHATAMFDMGDSMKKMAEENGGFIEGTKKLQDTFRNSLLDVNGQFTTTSRQSVEFSRTMDKAAESVLQVGVTELQRLMNLGKTLPEAQAGALTAMEAPMAAIKQNLLDLGFSVPVVDGMLKQLGLDPEKLKGALVLETKDFDIRLGQAALRLGAIQNGNWEVALGASSDLVKEELLKIEGAKEAWEKDGWKGVIEILDKTGPGVAAALTAVEPFQAGGDKSKIRMALEVALEKDGLKIMSDAQDWIDRWNDNPMHPKTAKVLDETGKPMSTAMQLLRGWNSEFPKPKPLKASDETKPAVDSANKSLETVKPPKVDLTATDKTKTGVDSAKGTMGAVVPPVYSLLGKDSTKPAVDSVNRSLLGAKDKTVSIDGDSKPFFDVLAGVRDTVPPRIVVPVLAQYSGSSEALKTLVGANGKANGGIMHNGVDTFANGGILKGAVKAYANGGIERHVAQIAYKTPAVPMRIWAEAEGGEAYIPLALSKRKRSLEILRRVMAEFGLQKYAMFADGGILKPQTPSVVSSRYATSAPHASQATVAASTGGSTINFTVNPSQGLSEQQIGESAMKELYWQIASR